MEKVLIWGTGATYKQFSRWFRNMADNKIIDILALIDRDKDKKEVDGYKVVCKDEIESLEFDRIIIAAVGDALNSIKKDADSLSLGDTCGGGIVSVVEYEREYARKNKKYYEDIIDIQIEILTEILEASDEEITDYDWMYSIICKYGVYPHDTAMKQTNSLLMTRYGVMQVAEEFTKYCNYIGTLFVRSAIEVGVYCGRTSYLLCALLARKNPELTYTMVDICDNLDSFDRFHEVLPMLKKRIPSTSADYKGEAYDFVFIDGDHSYDGSIEDYYNVGQYAEKIISFHDIYGHEYDGLNGGIARTWREVVQMTEDKEHRVFSKYPGKWMGIGCVLK